MQKKVTKAIFPVAGLGTRFLPATKAIPKEIMTLVDKPLIQYAIDEARAAGIKEFIFVTSRGKGALEDYFVIFAEMRTGSNFLESNLNQFEELKSFVEAFNPNFIGFPTSTDILGISLEERETAPLTLIDKLKEKSDVLRGFRFFHDHEPRVLETILNDPRCAKIVLIRNPVESYVSWKIAKSTDQWKLTNAVKRKSAKITFDAASFEQFLANVQNFQLKI